MTSNIGADKFKRDSGVGFFSSGIDESIQQKLRGYFKDEFINRIDEILLFSPLDNSALKEIAKIKIFELTSRLSSSGITVRTDSDVFDLLAEKASKNKGFGARPLNRLIISEIENKIADMIVKNEINPGDDLHVFVKENKIDFKRVCLALK